MFYGCFGDFGAGGPQKGRPEKREREKINSKIKGGKEI